MFSIYHITPKGSNWTTDKGYIGYTDDVEARMKKHASDARAGSHLFVHEAMRKLECEHEILSTCYTELYAQMEESNLRPDECMGWNMSEGGNNMPFSGKCLWTDVLLTQGKR